MRIEQVEIEVEDDILTISQDDLGFGAMSVYFPISQWEYLKQEIDRIIKEYKEE
jgi:hypothetical protein